MVEDPAHDPMAAFEVDETKQLLAEAINRAQDRERLVTLYYYEGGRRRSSAVCWA